jgi:hypothetical protein
VQHYPNGSTLSANDSTSNGNNGTINGNSATSGEIDGAATWDGSSNYIGMSSSSSLDLTGDMTLDFWIKPSSVSSTTVAMEKGHDPASDCSYGFGWASDGKLSFIHQNNWAGTSNYVMSAGTWQHVAMVRNSSARTITYYVNGLIQGSFSYGGLGPVSNSDILAIGRRGDSSDSTYSFGGSMDEMRITGDQRSADWIATEYNNESSPSTFYSVGSAQSGSGSGGSTAATLFIHHDHLGSTRLMTTYNQIASQNGQVYDSMDYFPFGEQIAGGGGTTHKFVGTERDSETGPDQALDIMRRSSAGSCRLIQSLYRQSI